MTISPVKDLSTLRRCLIKKKYFPVEPILGNSVDQEILRPTGIAKENSLNIAELKRTLRGCVSENNIRYQIEMKIFVKIVKTKEEKKTKLNVVWIFLINFTDERILGQWVLFSVNLLKLKTMVKNKIKINSVLLYHI